MGEQLTESDVKKIKEEIEYRKIVVRKKELEAVKEARTLNIRQQNRIRTVTKAVSAIWNECLRMRRLCLIHLR